MLTVKHYAEQKKNLDKRGGAEVLDYNEINREIDKLENGNTTYSNIEKLAMLYTVRDKQDNSYSYAPAPFVSSSEFITVASKKPIEGVLNVLDEHMDAIKALYPKEYDVIIKKIEGLP